MLLIDVVSQPNFKFSRHQAAVYGSLCSVIKDLTGTDCSHDRHLRSIAKQLVDKYVKRKKGKDQFLKIEESWLCSQEVRVRKGDKAQKECRKIINNTERRYSTEEREIRDIRERRGMKMRWEIKESRVKRERRRKERRGGI